MDRSPSQWQAALFPEATTLLADLLSEKSVTLRDLGARSARDAERLGYVCIRPDRPKKHPALFVRVADVPSFEAAAEAVADHRKAKRRHEADRLERRRTEIQRLLDPYQWLTEDERTSLAKRIEASDARTITRESIEQMLVPRRLARALDGISGVRLGAPNILVTGDVRFTAFGEEIVQRGADLATLLVDEHLHPLLLATDLSTFREAIKLLAAEARAKAVSALRQTIYERVAEASQLIDDTARLVNPDSADEIRRVLTASAVERLAKPGARALGRVIPALREIARDAVWSQRKEMFRLGRTSHTGSWVLAGERKDPLIAYVAHVDYAALGSDYSAVLHRRIEMPRDLREAVLGQPVDVAVDIADALVAEHIDDERAEIERTLERVTHQIARGDGVRGFDRAAVVAMLRTEFSSKTFDAEALLTRIRSLVERLVRQAKETEAVQTLLTEANFARYADFFTPARSMQRRLELIVGPTNSGKTYQALNALAEGSSGIYLAPLRLLALEGQEELEKRGCPTSFLTGEERDLREGATFWSSTIEMMDMNRIVDAAVIDEVQLLSDADRGWAWSAAMIGAPAKRIIMTGSPDCVPLVEDLARYLGEPLSVRHLERFNPLAVHESASDLDHIEPGTAVVCFSRRDVLGLKQHLEQRNRVSVIYGNLSPPVRREEARRFRSGETKVLVATDAIALGLNLPIKTVIFYSTWKFNGREEVRLTPSEIRQIGGRAGRYGKHDAGFVGALTHADLVAVRDAFDQPPDPLPIRAQVRPGLQHVLTMSGVLNSKSLARLLDLFRRRIRFDASQLVASVPDEMLELAALADATGMPLEDRFVFACAPVDSRNAFIMRSYQLWMAAFAEGRRSRLERLPSRYEHTTGESDPEAFYHSEVQVKLLTVYAWLAYRYPDTFPELEECDRQRAILNRYIERTLRKRGRLRRCKQCGAAMPAMSTYALCDGCFKSRRRM